MVGLLIAIFFGTTLTVSALSLVKGQNTVSYSPLQAKEKRMAELKLELQSKQEEVSKTKPVIEKSIAEAKELVKAKEELASGVSHLKSETERLADMFVKINKHSFDAAGNRYAAGNCTWYVKSMRPDISNSWGNANTWYSNAAAQGWKVGSTPKKGAVATTTKGWAGHVAYVTKVTPDGKWVTIREMNYGALYAMNTRTVYYTEFQYIYQLD